MKAAYEVRNIYKQIISGFKASQYLTGIFFAAATGWLLLDGFDVGKVMLAGVRADSSDRLSAIGSVALGPQGLSTENVGKKKKSGGLVLTKTMHLKFKMEVKK